LQGQGQGLDPQRQGQGLDLQGLETKKKTSTTLVFQNCVTKCLQKTLKYKIIQSVTTISIVNTVPATVTLNTAVALKKH